MSQPLESARSVQTEPSIIHDAQLGKDEMGCIGLETALTNINLGYEILRRAGVEELFGKYNHDYLRGEGTIVRQGDMFLKPLVNHSDSTEKKQVIGTTNSLSLRWTSATEHWKDDNGEVSPVHYQFNMTVFNGQDLLMGVTRDLVKQHLHAKDIFSPSKGSISRISSVGNRGVDDVLLPFRLQQDVLFDDPTSIGRVKQWVKAEGDNCITKGLAMWYPQFLPYRVIAEKLHA